MPVVEPEWAKPARELGLEHADDLIEAPGRLYEGRLDVSAPFGALSVSDVAELAVERPAVNPVWWQWDADRGAGRSSWPDVRPVDGEVASPPGLLLRSMHSVHADRWDTRAVADYLLVAESTVRSYVSRQQMPEPDGRLGRVPWWWADTIRGWRRPGQGARTDLRGGVGD